MQLLVSVATAAEASAALAGGADVIDAKDPHSGALGAVSMDVFRDISVAVAGGRSLSAALGDAADEDLIERDARARVAAGALFVKVGFGGVVGPGRVARLAAAAIRGARVTRGVLTSARTSGPWRDDATMGLRDEAIPEPGPFGDGGVIVVAYADEPSAAGPTPMAFVALAARAGAAGVLLDTANKSGPGLRGLVTPSRLAAWVSEAHEAGLVVSLAGRLTADDLGFVRDAGADIAGVRGAACDGGRTSRVTAERVRGLRARLRL
jgi:uncharacterized protein (UPF0264 family)